MVPDKFIINVNRSYSAIVNAPNSPNSSDDPPLIITMKINPTLIKGGGPRSLPIPLFLISGKIHQFHQYIPNLVEKYISEHYPDCNKCFRSGFTSPNCNPCKQEVVAIKNKLKQDLKEKNLNSRQIRAELNKVKAPSRCRNCSEKHLYIDCNSEKPHCHLDTLNHRVADRQRCEYWRTIKSILTHSIKLNERNINPLHLSVFKLADHMLTDKKILKTVPTTLQPQLPQNVLNPSISSNTNTINKSKSKSSSLPPQPPPLEIQSKTLNPIQPDPSHSINHNHNETKLDDILYDFNDITDDPVLIERPTSNKKSPPKPQPPTRPKPKSRPKLLHPKMQIPINNDSEEDTDMQEARISRKSRNKNSKHPRRSRSRSRSQKHSKQSNSKKNPKDKDRDRTSTNVLKP